MAEELTLKITLQLRGHRRLAYAATAVGLLRLSDERKRRLLNMLLWLLRVRWAIDGRDQGILQL